jgi:biotin operon repressor
MDIDQNTNQLEKPRESAKPSFSISDKLLLNLEEVSALLNISRTKLDSLITPARKTQTPRIRTVREGRRVYVTRQDLEKYVQKLRVESGIK